MADTGGRGFASMDKEELRKVAQKGGKASGGNPQNLTREARARGGRNSRGGGRKSGS